MCLKCSMDNQVYMYTLWRRGTRVSQITDQMPIAITQDEVQARQRSQPLGPA
jgi:hypothetical protein